MPELVDELREFDYLVKSAATRILSRIPQSVGSDELLAAGRAALFEHLRRSDVRDERLLKVRIRGGIIDWLRRQDRLPRRLRKSGDVGSIVGFEDMPEGVRLEAEPRTDPKGDRYAEVVRMLRLLDRLPPREREVLRLILLEGEKEADVAARFKVSTPRIAQLKARAIGLLRAMVLQVTPL